MHCDYVFYKANKDDYYKTINVNAMPLIHAHYAFNSHLTSIKQ